MFGHNFHHHNVTGVALVPQSVNNNTANGAAISEPWRIGRQLSFILIGGAFGTAVTGTMKVQAQQRSDGSWVQLKAKDGVTDLQFDAALLADASSLENGSALGTLDLARLDADTYKAIRLVYVNAVAQAVLIGAAFVISGVFSTPSGQADNLFSKLQP